MERTNGTRTFIEAVAGQAVSIITIIVLIASLMVTMASKADKGLVSDAEARCNKQMYELKCDLKERVERMEGQQKEILTILNAIDKNMVEHIAKEVKR